MDSLSRDLVKSFAEVVNEPKQKEPVRYVRGTITGKGDAKYVQLDGSAVATPISEVVDAQEGDRVLVSIENHRAIIVGNFTFSPSARQEQEALEKAEGAENTANSAGETANAAQLAAQEASKNANEAMGAASAASSSAAEAKDQAADAMVAAGNAQASANEAKESATQANENATQAKTDAANAQAAVANANEEIGKINDAIETAQGDIDQALDDLHSQAGEIEVIKRDYSTKVETENVKAELSTQITESVGQLQTTIQQNYYTKNDIVEIQGNLQSQITQNAEGLTSQATKVEKLESDTAEAQKQVDQALEKANSAQQAATQAKQDAEAATEAAETAQTEAATAAEKAQNANDAALDAKLAAHVADKALADAREALDQARENYKNVVSNPGSTAEDIANAAAQVETARQAVETALEDAAEAQYVANKAQEAADVAQEEANAASQAAQTAQSKADAAEQAANNAQAAAEQAAENVAALTKRVTTAETKIDQNAEQISLNATKTEEIGDKLVNDYYSKTETDALIKVESDRITSTVSKVETVEKTAITSTIEEFYLSSSPTSLSGGSWVTTQPTWTQGKYIWRRTKVTKGDGTTSYSPSQNGVCITGNTGATGARGPQGDKGDTGATGATGNGISKTEVYYYLSTSNTTQSGGSWSTTVPTWIDGRYYWQKIKTTYTNGSSSESTPVCITGGKGATGATGNTGATGKGVSSITTEFYLSNSKTTQSGGSWTTTMPTWTSGKYLWTRNKIVYTNPSSTAYTTPVCDSSWEAVNEVEETVSQIETRVTAAEQKITDDAIVTTVRKSTLYKNDLNGKVNSTEIISTINQTAESIKIQASKIQLEGLVTANNYFKILTDGSIEAVNSKFTGTITATNGIIGGWTIQKDSLTCVSHNDGFNVTYTTYIDANNGLIKFLSTSNDYETIISINGMEMHAGRQDGDRWIYDDIYYGVNGISKGGSMTGETFSLDAHGVSFGLVHNLVRWSNGGGFIATNNEVSISNNCTASSFYTGNWFRSTGQTGWYNETYGGGIYMADSPWVRVYNSKAFLCNNNIRAGEGNQNTTITNNWIGFYRASDGGRVGWMGANSTNDLYFSAERGSFRFIGGKLIIPNTGGGYTGGLHALRSDGNLTYLIGLSSGNNLNVGTGSLDSYAYGNTNIYSLRGYIMLAVDTSGSGQIRLTDRDDQYGAFFSPVTSGYICLGNSNNRFFGVYLSHSPNVSSDKRIKNNIIPISKGLKSRENIFEQLFDLLKPVSFSLNNDKSNKTHIGFVAQDVSNALSSLGVKEDNFELIDHMFFTDEETGEEKDEYGLRYEEFIALNTHMIQKANTTIQSQQKEIDDLKKQVQDLQELVLSA